MIYQSLDDKKKCYGVYCDGKIHYTPPKTELEKTWKASSSLLEGNKEYAWIYSNGRELEDLCPDYLKVEYKSLSRVLKAHLKAFEIAKVPLDEICIYDLVPNSFLLEWCEVKNNICEHVFENFERPKNYEHLAAVHELLTQIRFQKLNLSVSGSRNTLTSSRLRQQVSKVLDYYPYVNYNLYGTITGRLTTQSPSFPILNIDKNLRSIVKPTNDWFISLDYNAADVRVLLSLAGEEQPQEDIHEWNSRNFFGGSGYGDRVMDREEAKVAFFSWIYNAKDTTYDHSIYNRKNILDKYYDGKAITNTFDRTIEVDEDKALSYLVQSTTNDLTLDRAVEISKILKGRNSFISFVIHDEIVIDFSDQDRDILLKIKDCFSNNKMGKFMTNVSAGTDFYSMKELKI